jgi:hypothetical protein
VSSSPRTVAALEYMATLCNVPELESKAGKNCIRSCQSSLNTKENLIQTIREKLHGARGFWPQLLLYHDFVGTITVFHFIYLN